MLVLLELVLVLMLTMTSVVFVSRLLLVVLTLHAGLDLLHFFAVEVKTMQTTIMETTRMKARLASELSAFWYRFA